MVPFRTTHKIQSINNIKNQWNECILIGTPANHDWTVQGQHQQKQEVSSSARHRPDGEET